MFAAAAAIAAGVVAKVTEQSVKAGTDGDVVLGVENVTAADTSIANTRANGLALNVFCTAGTDGDGLLGQGSGFGVVGQSFSTMS